MRTLIQKQTSIARTAFIAATLVIGLGKASAQAVSQADADALVSPRIGTAKTIFVSNAGEEMNELSTRVASQVSLGMKQWDHYKVTTDPAAADLIFETRYITSLGIFAGSPEPFFVFRVRLTIRDRATQTILWTTTEFLDVNAKKRPFSQSVIDATNLVVEDVKSLASGHAPLPPPPPDKK